MGIIDDCQCDWFKIILDYIGFVPSRYYLRETCKAITASIPAKVYLSSRALNAALREKLINPKHLFLIPNDKCDISVACSILESYALLRQKSPKLAMMLLEKTFLQWDLALVAKISKTFLLRIIEWDAYLAGHTGILEKANLCITKHQHGITRSVGLLWSTNAYGFIKDSAFWYRLIREWYRPNDIEGWRMVLNDLIRKDAPRVVIDYVISECGLESMQDLTFMIIIAQSNHVDLIEQYFAIHWKHNHLNDFNIGIAISHAVSHHRKSMVHYLVGRFGLKGAGICTRLADEDSPNAIDILDFLIAYGADINFVSPDEKKSPLEKDTHQKEVLKLN